MNGTPRWTARSAAPLGAAQPPEIEALRAPNGAAERAVHPRCRRPWLLAALALAALGPGFFLVYGWCNAFTAGRTDVHSFYFAWERFIPFVPVLIVPYLSLDLFFSGSFFLCRRRAELGVLSQRYALAILLSAAGFLLFPLRYGWPRPAVEGWLGALFAPLNALDQPFNLCPSLHISLRTIAWTVYGRHTRGPLRHTLHLWFFLIGLSTLLTYQHHLIDLAGGWMVAACCVAVCRERPDRDNDPRPATSPTGCSPPCSSGPSGSSPGPACAGSGVGRTRTMTAPAVSSGSILPTIPPTWTPWSSGRPCPPGPAGGPDPSPRATTGTPAPSAADSPRGRSAP